MEKLIPERMEHGRPMLLAGLRQWHRFSSAGHDIAAQWHAFHLRCPLPGQTGKLAYGVMCGSNPEQIEYMTAAEVASFEGLPEDLGRICILEQDYAVFVHEGHASALGPLWQRIIHEWLPGSDWQSAHKPDFEVYDPLFDPQTGLGRIEIRIAVVPKTKETKLR